MKESYGWHPPLSDPPVLGRLLSAVRYLGPYLSLAVTMNVEIQKRIKAANINFVDFAAVFKSTRTPRFGKRVLVPHHVGASLVYGSYGAGTTPYQSTGTSTASSGTTVPGQIRLPAHS